MQYLRYGPIMSINVPLLGFNVVNGNIGSYTDVWKSMSVLVVILYSSFLFLQCTSLCIKHSLLPLMGEGHGGEQAVCPEREYHKASGQGLIRLCEREYCGIVARL